MNEYLAEKAIAEGYLDEMLEAERTRDFGAWGKRWDASDLEGLDEEVFQRDLDDMDRVLGAYRSRVYFGVLKGGKNVSREEDTSVRLRFVWRMIYEKNEALSVVGIRKRDGRWIPYKNACQL